MAGNVNTAPTRNKYSATRFKALFLKQRKTGGDPTDFGMNPAVVPLTIELAPGQTGDAFQVQDSTKAVLFKVNSTGVPTMPALSLLESQLAASSGFGLGVLRTARAKYDFAVDGGAISTITLATNATIPANAIILGGIINPTTAFVGATATIGFGTLAGSSATALKGQTAVASYTLDALMATVPVFTAASAVKMSAAGTITMTIATAALTAGVAEITVVFFVAAAA